MVLQPGITLMHEHTRIDLSGLKANDDCNLDCFADTVAEYRALYQQGVRNIIDVTNTGMGQDPTYVQRVAEATGINIVQATGFYQQRFYPPLVLEATVDQLAAYMIAEIEEGIAQTGIRAGIIGEIGTSKNEMTTAEAKVFQAAIQAARHTGVPITTHTTLGTYGKEQVAFFQQHEFPLHRVMIGHVDLTGDVQYVLALLATGVYVEFDTIGKHNYLADEVRCEMLAAIEAAGYEDRVCLSLDITRKSHFSIRGGIGYTYLLDTFVPLLRQYGVSQRFIDKMLVTNPQQFFAQSERKEVGSDGNISIG